MRVVVWLGTTGALRYGLPVGQSGALPHIVGAGHEPDRVVDAPHREQSRRLASKLSIRRLGDYPLWPLGASTSLRGNHRWPQAGLPDSRQRRYSHGARVCLLSAGWCDGVAIRDYSLRGHGRRAANANLVQI